MTTATLATISTDHPVTWSLWPIEPICAAANDGPDPVRQAAKPATMPAHAEPAIAPSTVGLGRDQHLTHHPRVLVVEDDDLLRSELIALLDEDGLVVVGEADNGQAGVRLAIKERPDVVLMDLRMPVMGGLEATREIRHALPQTQIVLLSAYDDPGLRSEGFKAGACGYLVKGGPSTMITTSIHDAWTRRRASDDPTESR